MSCKDNQRIEAFRSTPAFALTVAMSLLHLLHSWHTATENMPRELSITWRCLFSEVLNLNMFPLTNASAYAGNLLKRGLDQDTLPVLAAFGSSREGDICPTASGIHLNAPRTHAVS